MQSENRTFFLILRRRVGDVRSLLHRNLQKRGVNFYSRLFEIVKPFGEV